MEPCYTCGGAKKDSKKITLGQAKADMEQKGRTWAADKGITGFYLCLRINGTGYLYREEKPDNLEWEYISLL